jgi:hypothetical protein
MRERERERERERNEIIMDYIYRERRLDCTGRKKGT